MKKLIYILSIISAISCNQNDNEINEEIIIESKDTIVVHDFVNDSIVSIWSDGFFEMDLSNSIYIKSYKLFEDEHVRGQIDSLITFTFKSSTITTFRVPSKSGIIRASVRNEEITFSDDVYVNMEKSKFIKKINLFFESDSINISDFEGLTNFNFIFKNNKLSRIDFSTYIEY